MSWLRILTLCFTMCCVSCGLSSPTDLPAAYEDVIRTEWALAQRLLGELDVDRVVLVVPEICTWVPHDGMVKTSISDTGWANGVFYPRNFVVEWNIHTPQVIRHEAGHAILHFLDHRCRSCFSVDNTVTLHSGEKCEDTPDGRYCANYLEAHK
jgi:hypothetical protein